MRTSRTRAAARIGLLAGAFVVALLLAELLLQIGAFVVRANGRSAPDVSLGEHRRVAAFGDSNTYGLYLSPDEAYPAQFEALWNATPDVQPIEVANLGYPGTNSSVIAREFGQALRSLDPDVVIVMVGVNDMWTTHVELGPESSRWDRVVGFIAANSRVLRFLSIARPGRDAGAGDIDGRRAEVVPGDLMGHVDADGAVLSLGYLEAREGKGSVDGPRLIANLERLVREARSYGVEPVLMTYPTDGPLYKFTNKLIRKAASRSGARLVDLTPVFTAHCPDPECDKLLFEDRHPRAPGYALIAQTLSANIGDLLGP